MGDRIVFTGPDGETCWFNRDKSECFQDDTYWNGHNLIGTNSGSQWIREYLYRTPGGRWVLNRDQTGYHSGPDEYRYITDEQARDWLLKAEGRLDNAAALQEHFGDVEEERGPGRPSMGPSKTFTVQFPEDLLKRADELAAELGLSRAEWLRRVSESALDMRERLVPAPAGVSPDVPRIHAGVVWQWMIPGGGQGVQTVQTGSPVRKR